MNEIRRNVPVDEQVEILKRGVADLVSEDDLRRKLARSLETGEPLRVKLGADPTRPDLHLGHAVILRKMRQFQDLGHKVILLIGDFTAMIGDPSGKSKTRPPLTLEETRANAHSYLEQSRLVLRGEPEVLEIRYNGEWLEPMGYADVIRLASRYTVARILERDDFTKRLNAGTPISLHELLYPVTQGYDSVALRADVELGGTDQLFNNLVGRALQRDYNQEPQVVMTLPLLVGLDGTEKMSKSLDNYVGLNDKPDVMFANLMKVPDELLRSYFLLLTDISESDIDTIISSSHINAHKALASIITTWLFSGGEIEPDLKNLQLSSKEVYEDIFLSSERRIRSVINDSLNNLMSMIKNTSEKIDGTITLMHKYDYQIDYSNSLSHLANLLQDFYSNTSAAIESTKNSISNAKLIKNLDLVKSVQEEYITILPEIDRVISEVNKGLDIYISQSLNNKSYQISQSSFERYRAVAKGFIPENIPDVILDNAELNENGISMAKLVVLAGLEPSNGAARKLIQNRGLKLNGETFTDPHGSLSRAQIAAGAVIQKGKDKFARVVLGG